MTVFDKMIEKLKDKKFVAEVAEKLKKENENVKSKKEVTK